MTKKLTIGILSYNNPNDLKAVLQSIFSQLDDKLTQEIEVLISDNSENFSIKEMLERYFDYKNIVYIKNIANIGFDRNVNQVIEKSTGKFCWTLSSNDIVDNGCIKRTLSVIDEYPDIGHICFDSGDNKITFDNNGVKLFKNYEDFLTNNDYQIIGGLISQNIFNKKYLPNDTAKYFDNHWIHLSIFLEITVNKPFIVIKNEFVIKPGGICTWAKNGHTFTTYTNLDSVVMNLKKIGYSDKCLNEYHKRFIKGLPHQVATARLYGLKLNKKSVSTLYKHSKNEKFIFILCFFILLIPVLVLKFFKKIWKII